MTKRLFPSLLTALILLSSVPEAAAQVRDPVKWTYSARVTGPGRYEVAVKAVIEKGWHLYSQSTPDGGPIPTAFRFTRNPLIEMTSPVREVGKMERRHEKLFGVDVYQYSNGVTFVQTLTVKGKVKTNLSGSVEYMVCNDSECLPPATQNFSVELR
jgi:thiol:disulfide interchange protein DsbD